MPMMAPACCRCPPGQSPMPAQAPGATDGWSVREEDVARLAPLGFHHVNFLGRYVFTPPESGQVRPLRDPAAGDDEDE